MASPRIVRATVYGLGSGILALLTLGLAAAVIPNPWFPREIDVRPQDYAALGIITVLAIGLGATHAFPRTCPIPGKRLAAGGVLSFLAISCPVCNAAIVLLIGTGGAMAWFAPIQPILALVAIGLLAVALFVRVQAIRVQAYAVAPVQSPVSTDVVRENG